MRSKTLGVVISGRNNRLLRFSNLLKVTDLIFFGMKALWKACWKI